MIGLSLTESRVPKKTLEEIEQKIKDYVLALGNEIKNKAIENLDKANPHRQWVTGQLAKSGRVDTKFLNDYEVEVIFSAPHAPFVEYGTDPHIAPLGPSIGPKPTGAPSKLTNPLDWWAWRVGQTEVKYYGKYGYHTTLGFGVWIKIMQKGSDPHPFLRPAITTVKARKDIIAKKYGLEFD